MIENKERALYKYIIVVMTYYKIVTRITKLPTTDFLFDSAWRQCRFCICKNFEQEVNVTNRSNENPVVYNFSLFLL